MLSDIEYHVNQFALRDPTSSDGLDPQSGGVATTIRKTISEHCAFIRRPAMLGAHLLGPVNWEWKQSIPIVPRFDELIDNDAHQRENFAEAFGSTVSHELAMLIMMDIEARAVKSIKCIIAPKSGVRVPCSEIRSRIWKTSLSGAYHGLAKLAVRVQVHHSTSGRSGAKFCQGKV